MDKIRFGIVGYGNIGKRHAHHILQRDDATLVAVASLGEKPADLDCPYYNSLDNLLAQEELDVLNVCTPNYLHCEHTVKGLQQNLHVVCEKPMAMNTIECDKMISTAKAMNKSIFVVKQNRYNPPVAQVKGLINSNALGNILLVNVNCFWNRNDNYYSSSDWRGKKKKDGGCLFTQFSHFVDILYYLVGDVEVVHGMIENFMHPKIEIEDAGTFGLRSKGGALINFNFSTTAFEKNMEGAITILGEKGTVKIGGQYLNTIEYQKIDQVEIEPINISAKANDYGLYQGSMSNHDLMIENVIMHLKGNAPIMTTAQEGREVVRIIEDMYDVVSAGT